MQVVTATFPGLLVNQGKPRAMTYGNLGIAVTYFSSIISETLL